ncbi:MAG: hypothetical protein ACW97P_11275 [Candidatus Hodarchaeales archaeon]
MSLKTTFNPPENATALQVRLYGLGAWLIGFIIMIVLCLTITVLEKIPINTNLGIIYISIFFVAFGLMITGCYRALTGKKISKNVNDYEVSYTRVIMGVMSFLLSILNEIEKLTKALRAPTKSRACSISNA